MGMFKGWLFLFDILGFIRLIHAAWLIQQSFRSSWLI
jgi:hypothetical protein